MSQSSATPGENVHIDIHKIWFNVLSMTGGKIIVKTPANNTTTNNLKNGLLTYFNILIAQPLYLKCLMSAVCVRMGHWCARTSPALHMGHGVPGVSAQFHVGQDEGHERVPARTHLVVRVVDNPFRVKTAHCLYAQVCLKRYSYTTNTDTHTHMFLGWQVHTKNFYS